MNKTNSHSDLLRKNREVVIEKIHLNVIFDKSSIKHQRVMMSAMLKIIPCYLSQFLDLLGLLFSGLLEVLLTGFQLICQVVVLGRQVLVVGSGHLEVLLKLRVLHLDLLHLFWADLLVFLNQLSHPGLPTLVVGLDGGHLS